MTQERTPPRIARRPRSEQVVHGLVHCRCASCKLNALRINGDWAIVLEPGAEGDLEMTLYCPDCAAAMGIATNIGRVLRGDIGPTEGVEMGCFEPTTTNQTYSKTPQDAMGRTVSGWEAKAAVKPQRSLLLKQTTKGEAVDKVRSAMARCAMSEADIERSSGLEPSQVTRAIGELYQRGELEHSGPRVWRLK